MRDHKTLILDKKQVAGLADMKAAIKAVEDVFREYGLGRTKMPPKIYLHLPEHGGDFRAMPAYVRRPDECVLKWVNVHPDNRRFGLPSVMAVIILSDPRNGLPLCIMAGGNPTNIRTGAAGGVAAKYLARKDSRVVGMVGCGAQARTQLLALLNLFKLKDVKVWGFEPHEVKDFIRDMKKAKVKFTAAKDIEECVRGSDIVVTTTPSRKPLVKFAWLKAGAHINAIGADAKGKQELEHWILRNAKVVVDSWEQASHSGEINVPVSYGQITRNNIYADIGQIVSGRRKGRTNAKEITVFDSTGLAIQDAAIADLIFKTAVRKRVGIWVSLA
ncbi:MAG: alanine dehydrogenase [Omnitrophica WOR_2 bacterium RIFCSPLOWO2_12_FULL_51_24]|nr:MAG: alanine dehydrogenase [Omnitrophica WOR_2 bacterium RIFCSPHIGHO2_01_FULL_49_10]OGX32649.1 MAG: alanine dehydrogenase [Omnitrophica WOR_2 bacterium RIFCSPLOWO2_02_FULL_50_19]OGX41916.1 MAG: alanine dehydrogenase [Omnitrophica WOR_2 bacterium RIFCSPLOWO2_12_FULL_51_24]